MNAFPSVPKSTLNFFPLPSLFRSPHEYSEGIQSESHDHTLTLPNSRSSSAFCRPTACPTHRQT